jgi:hypothetical protein
MKGADVKCSVGESRNTQVLGLVKDVEHKSWFRGLGFSQSLAFFTWIHKAFDFAFSCAVSECTMKDNGEIVGGAAIPLPLPYSRLQIRCQGKPKNLPSTASSST